MAKPEDKDPEKKEPPKLRNRPPRPPAGWKKPSGVPKGPVPPRGQGGLPRIPPPGGRPTPPSGPTPPMNKPPMKPPMPGRGFPGLPKGPLPLPPAAKPMEQGLNEAEQSQDDLEKKVQDLEKKLSEEKEKALLAVLKNKEEEAISAKVETSIKDIQDKLRREKKEVELLESKRKAEGQVADIERRLAEEREAWVATLKTQLNQRDDVTQEMESHFSSRLKDLEYRWAQEKTGLENAIRDKEAEIQRITHDMGLKLEKEKSERDDRLRSVQSERDNLTREVDRWRDKVHQEREQFMLEKQAFRDSQSKLESELNIKIDAFKAEKSTLRKDLESTIEIERNKSSVERENLKSQISGLSTELRAHEKKLIEKTVQADSLGERVKALQDQLDKSQSQLLNVNNNSDSFKSELTVKRDQVRQYENQIKLISQEKDAIERNSENLKRKKSELEFELGQLRNNINHHEKNLLNQKRKYDEEVLNLKGEVQRIKDEKTNEIKELESSTESRIKTMQNRLDWYDSNIQREYEEAKRKAAKENNVMGLELQRAKDKLEVYENEKIDLKNLMDEKEAVENELEKTRTELNQAQFEFEARLKRSDEEIARDREKHEDLEEKFSLLEQESVQKNSDADSQRTLVNRKQAEIERLLEDNSELRNSVANEKEKNEIAHHKMSEYKEIIKGKRIETDESLLEDLETKDKEIERLNKDLRKFKDLIGENERQEELLRDKQGVYRETIDEKNQMISEFKNRIQALERNIDKNISDREFERETFRKKEEQIKADRDEEISKSLMAGRKKIEEELKDKLTAEISDRLTQEIEDRVRAENPSGPDPQAIESQVRSQMENEILDRMREQETAAEEKIKQATTESKKEMDKIKWENETLKEDIKKLRSTRIKIEREAQDLLRQAEDHYHRELKKQKKLISKKYSKDKGIFTIIGGFLDKPIINTKKDEEKEQDENAA